MIAIRHESVRYQDWTTWRAWRMAPALVRVETFRACCSACAGRGVRIERIPWRNTDFGRMGFKDPHGRWHPMLVICETCDGAKVIEQRYAVMA